MYFKKPISALLLLSFLFTPFTSCYGVSSFRQGMEAFEAGHFEEAKTKLCPLARKGSVIAQAYVERAEEILKTPEAARFKSKKPFSHMSAEDRAFVAPVEKWVEASVIRLMYTGNSPLVPKEEAAARGKIRALIEKDNHNANAWRVWAEINSEYSDRNFTEAFAYGEYNVAHQIPKSDLNEKTGNQRVAFLSLLERLKREENEGTIYWELYRFFQPTNRAIANKYIRMALYHGNGEALFPYLEGGYLSSETEGDRMVHWFAAHGNKKALCTIGYYHEHGTHGFALNLSEAFRLYSEAASGEDGYNIAQFNCGIFLRKGKGTKRNLSKAVQQFRRAFRGGFGRKAADEMRDTLQELYATQHSGAEEDLAEAFMNVLMLARKAEDKGSFIVRVRPADPSATTVAEAPLNLALRSDSALASRQAMTVDSSDVVATTEASVNLAPRSNISPAKEQFYAEAVEILGEVPLDLYTADTWKLLVNLLIVHHQRGTDDQWSQVERFLNRDRNRNVLLLSELYRIGGGPIPPQVELANRYLLEAIRGGDKKALARVSAFSLSEFEELRMPLQDLRRMLIEGGDPHTAFALAADSYEDGNLDEAERYARAFLPYDQDGYGHRNLAITLWAKRGGENFNEEELVLLQEALTRGCFEVLNDLGADAYRSGQLVPARDLFLQAQEKGKSKPFYLATADFMLAESKQEYDAVKISLVAALEREDVKPEQRHEVAVMFLGLFNAYKTEELDKAMDAVVRALEQLRIAADTGFIPSLELKLKLEQVLWNINKQVTAAEQERHVRENARLLALQGKETTEETFDTLVAKHLSSGALKTLEDLLDPKKPSVDKAGLKTLLGQLMTLPGVQEGSMGPTSRGFQARFDDSILGIHFKHKPGKGNAEVRGGRKTAAAQAVREVLDKARQSAEGSSDSGSA